MTEHTENGPSEYAFCEPERAQPIELTEHKSSTDVGPTMIPTDGPSEPTNALGPKKECCNCSSVLVKYTCPECDRHTCSLHCVNEHKHHYNCTGILSVTKHVDLSEYTGLQIQRDYHFLEDCRRIIDNAERSFIMPDAPQYKFHALPPSLRTLREEAGKRGVICQIMSEGMRKRDENTSRYDRCNNTIIWKCGFVFRPRRADETNKASTRQGELFTVSTDWASERHKLGDVLQYCWAINPPLPCFHINRKYNKVSKYVGRSTAGKDVDLNGKSQTCDADASPQLESSTSVHVCDTEQGAGRLAPSTVTEPPPHEETQQDSFANAAEASDSASEKPVLVKSPVPFGPLDSTCLFEQHPGSRAKVEGFLSAGRWAILAKAERLGSQEKYFRLNPSDTLNEALRVLFFINEYPVFTVVYEADLPHYPLVTSEDKEAIRESFRVDGKRKPPTGDCGESMSSGNLRKLSQARDRQCWGQGPPHFRGSERPRKDSGFSQRDSHGHVGRNPKRPRDDNVRSRSARLFYQRKTS
ncbi:unnamed protein product [Phytomonas sp. EM1]|nr:unnamed protein product [Phytomonas sp. EM1]|eukprot:CCW62438.1 unnamed protein product [Phytomonas sp. isolate EM1]